MGHADAKFEIPLPKRIWQYWDQPCLRLGFYRSITLTEPIEAKLHVSASGDFKVWIDREEVVFPSSSMPSWYAMRSAPVKMDAGSHEVRIIVAEDGQSQPFLMCCLDWEENGNPERLVSDKTWTVEVDPGMHRGEWGASDQNKSAWEHGGVWVEPWGMPCDVPDDFCRLGTGWQEVIEQTLYPVVEEYQGFEAGGGKIQIDPDGAILSSPVRPYPNLPALIDANRPASMWHLIRESQSLQTNNWLNMYEYRNPWMVFDVGKETFARIQVKLRSGGPAIIAVASGESLPELHHYSRRCSDVFSLQNGETFSTSPTGFRYVKVMVLSCSGEKAVLEPLIIQHIRYPVQARGSFQCNDEDLNKIWELSQETLHLCMQNEIWDGIRRDQLPWMGDLYVEALAAYIFFADRNLSRRTLAILAELGPAPVLPLDQQKSPGLQAIWRSANGDINGIPSYTLWWVVGLYDYFIYTGDQSLLMELLEPLKYTIRHFMNHLDETGLWSPRGEGNFIDWSPVPEAERQLFCHLLTCHVLGLGIKLFESIGELEILPEVQVVHRRMVERARSLMKLPVDSVDSSDKVLANVESLGVSHHVHAMAIRSGVLSSEEAKILFAKTLQPDTPFWMTYWHRYADLDACTRAGDVQWGLDYIRRHWGLMLKTDTSTLWESFDPAWLAHKDPHSVSIIGDEHAAYGGYRTSLCHAWSAGAAVWLSTVVLGVSPIEPGFKKIRFQPAPGDLKWAKGRFPTPQGMIDVTIQQENGCKKATIFLPAQIAVELSGETKKNWEIEIQMTG